MNVKNKTSYECLSLFLEWKSCQVFVLTGETIYHYEINGNVNKNLHIFISTETREFHRNKKIWQIHQQEEALFPF